HLEIPSRPHHAASRHDTCTFPSQTRYYAMPASRRTRQPTPRRPNWRDHWPAILTEIANGGTLRQSCRDRNIPPSSILQVITGPTEAGKVMHEQYMRAREAQAHAFADDILETAERERLVESKFATVVDP